MSPRRLLLVLVAAAVSLLAASPVAAGAAPDPADYNTIAPCRVFDSRLNAGTPLAHGAPTPIPVGGLCTIPDDGTVIAVATNVTATQPSIGGHLSLYAAGESPPPGVVNFSAGQTRANNAIVRLSADGDAEALADVQPDGTVHLIVDVIGYFVGNLPPVAVDDSATVTEDDAATAIPVLSNDTDAEGHTITIASAGDPANGTVVLTGGSPGAHTGLTYQPDAEYCNSPPGTTLDTFTYTVNGGDTATVSVTVTCVNDGPVVDAATFALDEVSANHTVVGSATFTDQDPGQTHSFAITAGNTGGAFAIDSSTGQITVASNRALDFCANPTFGTTVQVTDNGAPPLAGSNTITINLNDVGGPPSPHVLANRDGDVPEYALFLENGDLQCQTDQGGCVLSNPTDGSVDVKFDGIESIDPRRDCDPPGEELSYHWEIFYPPTVQGGTRYTAAGISGYFEPVLNILPHSLPDLQDQGSDQNWRMRLTLISNVQPSPLTTVALFRFQYQNSDLTVDMSTTCQAQDPACTIPNALPAPCGACTNRPPVAINDSAAVAKDDPASAIPVLANDTDNEGDPIFIASATDPANGTVVLTGGTPGAHTGLTYQPDASYCTNPPGTTFDTFTYTLNGSDTVGDTATVSMTVDCVNAAPVVEAATFALDEVSANRTVVGNVAFTDQNALQTHSFAITAGNTGGAFAIHSSTGQITVASNRALDFCANPTFGTTVQVADNGAPPLAGSNTITINLNDVDGPPSPHMLANRNGDVPSTRCSCRTATSIWGRHARPSRRPWAGVS